MVKNGGFPPIKFCKEERDNVTSSDEKPKKERFFSNTMKNNINIRQILVSKKDVPIIDISEKKDKDELEVVDSI